MVVTIADETGRMDTTDPTITIHVQRLYAPIGTANIATVVTADDVSRGIDTKRINVPIRARRILPVGKTNYKITTTVANITTRIN